MIPKSQPQSHNGCTHLGSSHDCLKLDDTGHARKPIRHDSNTNPDRPCGTGATPRPAHSHETAC